MNLIELKKNKKTIFSYEYYYESEGDSVLMNKIIDLAEKGEDLNEIKVYSDFTPDGEDIISFLSDAVEEHTIEFQMLPRDLQNKLITIYNEY